MTNPTLPGTVPQLVRVTVPQPAVGTEWVCTVPNGTTVNAWPGGVSVPGGGAAPTGAQYARLLTGATTLVQNATAANRYPGAQVRDTNGNRFSAIDAGVAAIGSFTQTMMYMRSYTWDAVGTVGLPGVSAGISWAALIMLPGFTFGSSTPGMQTGAGGDQYTQIELFLEVWTSAPIWDGGTVQNG